MGYPWYKGTNLANDFMYSRILCEAMHALGLKAEIVGLTPHVWHYYGSDGSDLGALDYLSFYYDNIANEDTISSVRFTYTDAINEQSLRLTYNTEFNEDKLVVGGHMYNLDDIGLDAITRSPLNPSGNILYFYGESATLDYNDWNVGDIIFNGFKAKVVTTFDLLLKFVPLTSLGYDIQVGETVTNQDTEAEGIVTYINNTTGWMALESDSSREDWVNGNIINGWIWTSTLIENGTLGLRYKGSGYPGYGNEYLCVVGGMLRNLTQSSNDLREVSTVDTDLNIIGILNSNASEWQSDDVINMGFSAIITGSSMVNPVMTGRTFINTTRGEGNFSEVSLSYNLGTKTISFVDGLKEDWLEDEEIYCAFSGLRATIVNDAEGDTIYNHTTSAEAEIYKINRDTHWMVIRATDRTEWNNNDEIEDGVAFSALIHDAGGFLTGITYPATEALFYSAAFRHMNVIEDLWDELERVLVECYDGSVDQYAEPELWTLEALLEAAIGQYTEGGITVYNSDTVTLGIADNGISVYSNASDAASATVRTTSDRIILTIIGGDDAGVVNIYFSNPASNTLDELVTVIEAIDGWNAFEYGDGSISSSSLAIRPSTNALGVEVIIPLKVWEATITVTESDVELISVGGDNPGELSFPLGGTLTELVAAITAEAAWTCTLEHCDGTRESTNLVAHVAQSCLTLETAVTIQFLSNYIHSIEELEGLTYFDGQDMEVILKCIDLLMTFTISKTYVGVGTRTTTESDGEYTYGEGLPAPIISPIETFEASYEVAYGWASALVEEEYEWVLDAKMGAPYAALKASFSRSEKYTTDYASGIILNHVGWNVKRSFELVAISDPDYSIDRTYWMDFHHVVSQRYFPYDDPYTPSEVVSEIQPLETTQAYVGGTYYSGDTNDSHILHLRHIGFYADASFWSYYGNVYKRRHIYS